jgi:alpha-L-arabinofuranosidase
MLKRIEAASFLIFLACIFLAGGLHADSAATEKTATLTVEVDRPGAAISPTLYGVFFEEINFAGDGGLYAELIRNRSFEDSDKPDHWTLIRDESAKGEMAVAAERPMSEKNLRSLRLKIDEIGNGRAGVANGGYFGIAVAKGEKYDLSLYARAAEGYGGSLAVTLESGDGKTVYAQANVEKMSAEWKPYRLELTSQGDDPKARLVISATKPGTVWLDMVSLFPRKTWKSRPNGLRPDLAEMLQNLHPAFLRFPGGCWVEGDTMRLASRWKKTIGEPSERWTQPNLWGYNSTNGLGYLEYLQMCEDLGTEPMFVINVGMSHKENVPMDKMGEFVQDALDAIEYANGPAESKWGSLRAKHGHPRPFDLKYLEIGNENGGPAYNERYALFYDAIKAEYPRMNLIANFWEAKAPSSRPVEILDEHYYSTPEFFMQQADRYDQYDRKGPKIFVGEYAATQNVGKGNLRAAVGEAAFMTGMERNGDVVVLSAYAPLFVNMDLRAWNPDLINFNSSRVFGIPSYYVQKMFAENRGDVVLPTKIEMPETAGETPRGDVGLGTWATQAEFKDVVVSSGEKTVSLKADGWKPARGDWKAADGAIGQSTLEENCRAIQGDPQWTDYTLSLKARKTGGKEGFLIFFHVRDDANLTWWNIGGWGNTSHCIEQTAGGAKSSIVEHVPGGVETGRWYDIRVAVKGGNVKCYLDGKLIHDVNYPVPKTLFAVSGLSKNKDEAIVKIVNTAFVPQKVELKLAGAKGVEPNAARIVLTSEKPDDENSLEQPRKVSPVADTLAGAGVKNSLTLPANSVTVLRFKLKP